MLQINKNTTYEKNGQSLIFFMLVVVGVLPTTTGTPIPWIINEVALINNWTACGSIYFPSQYMTSAQFQIEIYQWNWLVKPDQSVIYSLA